VYVPAGYCCTQPETAPAELPETAPAELPETAPAGYCCTQT